MFVLATIADTVRIPATMLAQPTMTSVHSEMDKKYPNRVIMDVGLVVCRYGNALHIGDGVCAAGDGGAHHEVIVRLVVFRPFVEEVCLGTIVGSTEEGVQVSLGFFEDIFVPAYWMLRPSHYEPETGLWVWTPTYEDDNDDDEEEGDQEEGAKVDETVKIEEQQQQKEEEEEDDGEDANDDAANEEEDGGGDDNRFEMMIGAEIRFKVKSINFTQVTNTAKGVQATTTTTSHSVAMPNTAEARSWEKKKSEATTGSVRKRSTSMDLSDSAKVPASMHIIASICEDGLGLTSWWTAGAEEEEPLEEDEGADGAYEDYEEHGGEDEYY